MNKELIILVAITAFVSTLLSSEEKPVVVGQEERTFQEEKPVVVGHEERTFQEEIAVVQEQQKEEIRFQEDNQVEITDPEDKVEIFTSGAYDDWVHKGCYHNVISKGADGLTIDTEDGATWSVSDRYKYIVKGKWNDGDSIIIGTSSYFFSNSLSKDSYRFEAFNRRNQTRVKINLSQGPFPSKCRALTRVDDYGRIHLNDGSCWQVSSLDTGLLPKWKWEGKEGSERHSIIIGLNNTFDSSWNPYILLNVDTNDYVRVRQVY